MCSGLSTPQLVGVAVCPHFLHELPLVWLNWRNRYRPEPRLYAAPAIAASNQSSLHCCQALVRMRLWCDIPSDKAASGLEVELPLPGHVSRVHCEVDPPGNAALQGWEFSDKTHLLKWRFKKVAGKHTSACRASAARLLFSCDSLSCLPCHLRAVKCKTKSANTAFKAA